MKHLIPVLCVLALMGPMQKRSWFVDASYAAVSYWDTPDCSGAAAYTQAYTSDFCFNYHEEGTIKSNKNGFVNSTHVAQRFFNESDCEGALDASRSFVSPIGLCVFGPTPYGNPMHQISFFAETAGPYSTTSSTAWAYFNYDSCDTNVVTSSEIDGDEYCWNHGSTDISFKEVGCDEDYFYFHIYQTKDCTGPFSTNTSMNREEQCIDDYTNLLGQSTRIKCLSNKGDNCEGTIELSPRSGPGSSWNDQFQSFQIFDIVVKNSGTCSIVNAMFPYKIDGAIVQSWNVFSSEEGSVITLLSPVLPGNIFTSAGLVIANYTSSNIVENKTPTLICSC